MFLSAQGSDDNAFESVEDMRYESSRFAVIPFILVVTAVQQSIIPKPQKIRTAINNGAPLGLPFNGHTVRLTFELDGWRVEEE